MDLSKVDWSQAIVCYSKCWECQFTEGEHPAEPHTWMDGEDIEFDAAVTMPKSPEDWAALAEARPCGCWCMADYLAAKKALKSATTEENDHG